MSSLEEEGQKIAERLGNGVTYGRPWLPYGPKGEFLGHFFHDSAVTGTSFAAKTFEEAKATLIKTRKQFGAKPPVFSNKPRVIRNNPGNPLIAKEEWDRAFFRVLPVASVGLGVVSIAVAIMTGGRSASLAQRVYYQDGQYLVSVRYPGQWYELRDFVQPGDPDIAAVYSQIGPDVWANLDFVCRNISYRRDRGEFWQFPSETLAQEEGDCEDSSLLLCSLLQNATDAYVVLGNYQGYGHAWCQVGGDILETTYTSARLVPDPEDYCGYLYFNNRQVIELWPGALQELFQVRRHEATKLNLMVAALQKEG